MNANQQPESNDPLETMLREADVHVADHGFTARVMTTLPPRRRASRARLVVLSLALVLGGALVAWQVPSFTGLLVQLPQQVRAMNLHYLLALVPVVAVMASLGWVMYALVNDEA